MSFLRSSSQDFSWRFSRNTFPNFYRSYFWDLSGVPHWISSVLFHDFSVGAPPGISCRSFPVLLSEPHTDFFQSSYCYFFNKLSWAFFLFFSRHLTRLILYAFEEKSCFFMRNLWKNFCRSLTRIPEETVGNLSRKLYKRNLRGNFGRMWLGSPERIPRETTHDIGKYTQPLEEIPGFTLCWNPIVWILVEIPNSTLKIFRENTGKSQKVAFLGDTPGETPTYWIIAGISSRVPPKISSGVFHKFLRDFSQKFSCNAFRIPHGVSPEVPSAIFSSNFRELSPRGSSRVYTGDSPRTCLKGSREISLEVSRKISLQVFSDIFFP